MNMDFYQQIALCTTSRKSRDNNRDFVLNHPKYLKDLFRIGFNSKDENHHKALWVLELICEKHPELFIDYTDAFCKSLSHYTNEQAIRAASKIGYLLTQSPTISLSKKQSEQIAQACLDWLIGKQKAAPKVFAIYTLHLLAKNDNWIRQELRGILENEYSSQKASYKAAVRKVFKDLT